MTNLEMDNLKPGDIIRGNAGSGQSYVVTENDGTRIIAVRTIIITNPVEWELVYREVRV